jgi:hypothetical protein
MHLTRRRNAPPKFKVTVAERLDADRFQFSGSLEGHKTDASKSCRLLFKIW